jgi:hypothetical protein
MVKYAKHIVALDQCGSDLTNSRTLIQETVQYWKIVSIS